MKNRTSNIKRMGIKSIHYNKNNIIIEDSFSKNNEYIYDAEYVDINDLQKLKDLKKNPRVKNSVNFNNIDSESGFELTKKIGAESLFSKIRSVKSKSYVQQLMNITDENNIEIQIYQNYEDLRKLITIISGNIFYSIK